MYYLLHELNHAAIAPWRAVADATKLAWRNPANPLTYTPMARSVAASAELFERMTRRYAKPEFGIEETVIDGVTHRVQEQTVWSQPFCDLLHFERFAPAGSSTAPRGPKLLIVAPMSGHYATLLRGTVEAMLPHADVFITDWRDARMVPLASGRFDLDDYIDYTIAMIEHLGEDVHVMAVCQPAVPVLAAVSLMEANDHPTPPASMTLMGGPIDTRINPTAVNKLAEEKPLSWFERKVIMRVPWPHPGFGREVYPGFLQLGGFMSMNLDRHVTAHHEFFDHLVEGDGDSAEKHRDFYDEYLAVMDLTAEFYLQTVETVFIEHALPKGEMMHRGQRVDPSAIRRTAMLTIEGENDDISGIGQTEAAHVLTPNIPDARRAHHVQENVGHYGIFNGSRFRKHIVPRVVEFIALAGTRDERSASEAIDADTDAARRRHASGDDVVPVPASMPTADDPKTVAVPDKEAGPGTVARTRAKPAVKRTPEKTPAQRTSKSVTPAATKVVASPKNTAEAATSSKPEEPAATKKNEDVADRTRPAAANGNATETNAKPAPAKSQRRTSRTRARRGRK